MVAFAHIGKHNHKFVTTLYADVTYNIQKTVVATSQKNTCKLSIRVTLRTKLTVAISSINNFEVFGSKVFTTIIVKSVARFRQYAHTNLGKRRFKPQTHDLRLKYDLFQ